MFVGNLYIFFGEMSIQVFCPFLDWVVCFFDIELHELLVYFGDSSFVSCFVCKYNEEKTASSISGAGKTGQLNVKE